MPFKETKRKGFNFFRSYYDVYNELETDRDKVAFIDALLDRQFLGIKPEALTGMAKFAYISQTNSIDSQVKGYEDKTKTSLNQTVTTPSVGGVVGGSRPPCLQVEEKEKGEGKGEGEEEGQVQGEDVQQVELEIYPNFDDFWDLYDKKTSRDKCEKKWKNIKQDDREKIMSHLELYIRATPDKQFRKNPETYLNNKSWYDEIILKDINDGSEQKTANSEEYRKLFAEKFGTNI